MTYESSAFVLQYLGLWIYLRFESTSRSYVDSLWTYFGTNLRDLRFNIFVPIGCCLCFTNHCWQRGAKYLDDAGACRWECKPDANHLMKFTFFLLASIDLLHQTSQVSIANHGKPTRSTGLTSTHSEWTCCLPKITSTLWKNRQNNLL